MKPGQPGQGQGGKGNFVICEICDGYIKDLEQLRNHMQWIHKVCIVLLLLLILSYRDLGAIVTSIFFTGQNPPQDDLQQASTKLSEMPIPVLHGPGSGAAPAGQPRPGDGQHAGRRQQGPGQRPVPRVRQGNQPHCLSWT